MPVYELAGVPVPFPYEAYDAQLAYMETSENAVLESPTGTGKTLCLLCATLGWRAAVVASRQLAASLNTNGSSNLDVYRGNQLVPMNVAPENTAQLCSKLLTAIHSSSATAAEPSNKLKAPLIVYSSRTHSQLAQVVSELRKTPYRPKLGLIGSREQLCIHPTVRAIKSNAAMTTVCNQLVKSAGCEYHGRVHEVATKMESLRLSNDSSAMMDIEDLVKIGTSHRGCPFYISRESLSNAELILLPYNYLIDKKSRQTIANLDLNDSIVIFDEAHNVENSCGDASSMEISSEDLRSSLAELEQCKNVIQSGVYFGLVTMAHVDTVRKFIHALESFLHGVKVDKEGSFTAPGEYIFYIFNQAGLNQSTADFIIKNLEQIARMYIEEEYSRRKASPKCCLQKIESSLRTIFTLTNGNGSSHDTLRNEEVGGKINETPKDACYFRVHLAEDKSTRNARVLSYWCFNPGLALKELQTHQLHSLIFTSGTISPLESLIAELQINFPHRLENTHVIKPNQIFCGVIPSGPAGYSLNSSFGQRDTIHYKRDLGEAILRTCQVVPDGVLVFFPSYTLMESCLAAWKDRSEVGSKPLFDQINTIKAAVVEPKTKGDLTNMMDNYYRHLNEGRGAIMFAVCRGKVSEGLDFADGKGRAVIITGIPYPPLKDPKVVLKRQYLEETYKGSSHRQTVLTGDEWYQQQAMRAVNQSIGRVIRHRHDYGAILLFDDRFCSTKSTSQLSRWVRPYVRQFQKFGEMQSQLASFFSDKQSQEQRQDENSNRAIDFSMRTLEAAKVSIDAAKRFFTNEPAVLDAIPSSITSTRSTHPDGAAGSFIKVFATTANASKESEIRDDPHKRAQEYLDLVRITLDQEGNRRFNLTIKAYRSKQLSIDELIRKIIALFAENGVRDKLLSGFRQFVPSQHRHIFDRLCNSSPVNASSTMVPPAIVIPSKRETENTESSVNFAHSVPSIVTKCAQINCPVCHDVAKNPYRGKCGHICCFSCWTAWLQIRPECPICRLRTRVPQLRKAH